jgi:Relaxase/Mobilisation nuclease domain.
MVAKINVGNSLFGALAYNQNKVDQGEGRVLCSNKMPEPEDGMFDINSCMRYFNCQLPQDIKTEKPILHISLNPHPDDVLTDNQLADVAEEYMQKMGYGQQPYMVYVHEDIERRHMHIVSLRVDATGRKINDSNNFYRSKAITRELEKKYGLYTAEKKQQGDTLDFKKVDVSKGNLKIQIGSVIKPLVVQYKFQSFNEYRSLLSLYNIQVEEVRGEVRGRKYNGLVYSATDNDGNKVGNPFKSSLYGKTAGYEAVYSKIEKSKREIKDWKLRDDIIRKIRPILQNTLAKKEFENKLTRSGIDVLFRENEEGRIYGVTFIDHQNRCVFNGSRLGKEYSANAFEERFNGTSLEGITPMEIPAEKTNHIGTLADGGVMEGLVEGALSLFQFEGQNVDSEEDGFYHKNKKKKKKQHRIKI